MSSNLPKPYIKMHKRFPTQPLYVPVEPNLPKNHGLPTNPGLDLVTDFDRHTSKSVTTPLLNKNENTNCKCCYPFRLRRKKLSKSGKKVGKKSDKKSGKVRKNKRKTRL
jgi:hypothetical protein